MDPAIEWVDNRVVYLFRSPDQSRSRMLDLDAPILPGVGAAGLTLGGSVQSLRGVAANRQELNDGRERLDLGAVLVWAHKGLIDQIGVRGPYGGGVAESGIQIGSTLQEAARLLGLFVEDEEDNLVVASVPGISFETEPWHGEPGQEALEGNLAARISAIYVFSVEAGQPGVATERRVRSKVETA